MVFSATREYRHFERINYGDPWGGAGQRAVVRLGEMTAQLSHVHAAVR